MKKRIIILAVFAFVISQQAFAQLSVGAKAGAQWSNVYTKEAFDNAASNLKSINEITYGVVLNYAITDNISLQTEVNFLEKGFRVDENTDQALFGLNVPLGVELFTKFNYIEVPIMGKYTFGDNVIKPYVLAGPTLGYATSGEVEAKATVLVPINVGTYDIDLESINYEKFEIGAVAGGGLVVDLNAVQIFADARYQLGFTQVNEIPYVDEKVKNKGVSLSGGVLIRI